MFNQQMSANPSALQQQQQMNLRMQTMVNAVKSPRLFDDDRDLVVTKFNVLQACSGVGKGIARVEGYNEPQIVDFTPENPFCKFKVILHNALPLSPSLPPSLPPSLSPSLSLSLPPSLPPSLHTCMYLSYFTSSTLSSCPRLCATIACHPVGMKMAWSCSSSASLIRFSSANKTLSQRTCKLSSTQPLFKW